MGQRELLDAESVAGHLLKVGSVFGFSAAHRRDRGLPATRIGVVDQGFDTVEVPGLFTGSLDERRATSVDDEGVLPGLFG